MKRPYIPFLIIGVLLLLTVLIPIDLSSYLAPGWHTTLYTPGLFWNVIMLIVLLLVIGGYLLLSKQVGRVDSGFVLLHLFLTILPLIVFKYPTFFISTKNWDLDTVLSKLGFLDGLTKIALAVFFLGQVIFLLYCIRTIRSYRTTL